MTDSEQNKRDMRNILRQVLANTDEQELFPITNAMDFIAVLPNGPETEFDLEHGSITARDVGMKYRSEIEFPYTSKIEFIQDIIESIEQENGFDFSSKTEPSDFEWEQSVEVTRDDGDSEA